MAENKTKATSASVDDYLAARANATQLADCQQLISLCSRLTGEPALMWGPSIVGFSRYQYRYDSGRTGEAPLTGFAVRGRELVVYLDCDDDSEPLLTQLGKHKMSKSCLYFKQLADLDVAVLEQLITTSISRIRQKYGEPAA